MRFFKIAKNGLHIFREIREAEKKETSYKEAGPRINNLLSELGPTFIKLGQMLSLRADLINPALADELRQLLDHGALVEKNDINELFRSELGKAPEELFDSFNHEPFAVASLAQVHLAHNKGKVLAVKIQKPGIKALVHRDLILMRRLLRLTGVFVFSKTDKNILRILKISTDEFFKWIEHELDYRLEALNITRIKNNLAELEFFEAPEVLHPFSTKLILTMDYIDGVSLNTLINFIPDLPYTPTIKYKNINCNKAVLIKEFVEVVFHQVFKDGYFHADPHPANILLTPKNHIAFIDFGIVGALQPHFRETLTTILTGMVERDVKKVSRAFIDFNQSGSTIEMSKVERGVSSVLDDWQTGSVIEMTMAEVFYRLLIVAQEAKIEVPLSVFILGKTVLEYDGLLRKFDPGMDILESLKSYVAGEGTLFGLKEIPIAIEDVLKHPENLPADVLKLTEQLAKDGVEFVSHFLPSVR